MEALDELRARVRQALPGFFAPLEVLACLPSTMDRAAKLADAGAPEGATVLADQQTAGRGRLGRRWLAPPGSSLLLSVVLRPRLEPQSVSLAAVAAGVALADATAELLPAAVPVGLKWPNDLLVGGRKAAGLLAEARLEGAAVRAVLLGMGVNVAQRAGDFPPELAASAGSLALAASGAVPAGAPGAAVVDRVELLGRWGRAFAGWYGQLAAGAAGEVLAAYRARLDTLGRRVRAERVGQPPVTGVAVDLTVGGALVVRDDAGGLVTLTAADVEHMRLAGDQAPTAIRRPR